MEQSNKLKHKATILLISALIVVAAGAITIFVIKGLTNVTRDTSTPSSTQEQLSAGDKKVQQANESIANGDLDAAIEAYKEAKVLYEKDKNEQGLQDAEFHIETLTLQKEEEARLTEEQEKRRTNIQAGASE